MGCFRIKNKKKKSNQVSRKPSSAREKPLAVGTQPETFGRSLQSAPPSFRTRAKSNQGVNDVNNSRIRALSAPSSLHVTDQDHLASIEFEEQEYNSRGLSGKDQRGLNPQPLPLPSPKGIASLKNMGSFKTNTSNSSVPTSGPLPLPPLGGLKNYSFEEVASACQHFSSDRCVSEGLTSMVYVASFGDDALASKKLEATVTRLLPSTQGLRDFVNEVHLIASLQHPLLCKLLGFHAREGSEQRMLVYERLYHGSLDRLLHGRYEGPSIDWATRMKIALCAAKGLLFLHEEGPFQAMYNEFSTTNIQIDKDFSAKLSGFGCVNHSSETDIVSSSAAASISVETRERGLLTPKSNVWSFGIVLLELLTGRKNLDPRYPKEERNLVKWSRPYLTDDCRLSLIMDPRLKGRFPPRAARTIADIALKCLQHDPLERPTMRSVVESLEDVQDMKYSCRFRLQEPAVVGKQMLKSPSFNGIVSPTPGLKSSSATLSPSPPRPAVNMPVPPPRTCSSTMTVEEDIRITRRSPPLPARRTGVEGF